MGAGIDGLARRGRRMFVAPAIGLAPAGEGFPRIARLRGRRRAIVVAVVRHAVRHASGPSPGRPRGEGHYFPGDVPVVLDAPAPFVPDVLELELGMVDVELLGEVDELLGDEELLLDEVSEGVVLVEPLTEPETEPEVLPGVEVLLDGVAVVSVVVEVLPLGVVVVVVVPGVTVVEVEELDGVEPELPVLLQPVAATEASAMTATRGIRRFMTSSPIWFTCVEDKGVGWFRCVGAKRSTSAASTRDNGPPTHKPCHGFHMGDRASGREFAAIFLRAAGKRCAKAVPMRFDIIQIMRAFGKARRAPPRGALRQPALSVASRPARIVSSCWGSTGFTRCLSKPASRARRRSSSWPQPVTATSTQSLVAGSAFMRRATS